MYPFALLCLNPIKYPAGVFCIVCGVWSVCVAVWHPTKILYTNTKVDLVKPFVSFFIIIIIKLLIYHINAEFDNGFKTVLMALLFLGEERNFIRVFFSNARFNATMNYFCVCVCVCVYHLDIFGHPLKGKSFLIVQLTPKRNSEMVDMVRWARHRVASPDPD